MKNFVVYAKSGEILRTGSCPDNLFDLQRTGEERIIEGAANDATQIVVDGKVVDRPEPLDHEKNFFAMAELRSARDQLLQVSDWTQIADAPLSEEKKIEWQEYRQRLRDLPEENQDILDFGEVVFPSEPS